MSVSFLLYVPLLLGLVAAYRCLRATRVMFSVGTISHKSNVLSDMHVLLSAAKNSTECNIRICDPKNIPINQK